MDLVFLEELAIPSATEHEVRMEFTSQLCFPFGNGHGPTGLSIL